MNDKNIKPVASSASLQPMLDEAMRHLQTGRFGEAEKVYRLVNARNPLNLPALFNLGLLASRRGALDEATGFFTQVLAISPQDADATASLAVLKGETGTRDEAIALAEKAIKLKPSASALTQLGVMFGQLGDTDAGMRAVRAALELDPANIRALSTLSNTEKLKPTDAAFAQLVRLAPNAARFGPIEGPQVLFALAKAYKDQGLEEKAYEVYAEGNALKRSAYKGYDIAQQEKQITEMIGALNADVVNRILPDVRAGAGETPLFVVGMPRSGSTLVEQIMSSHPQARGIGESPAAGQAMKSLFAKSSDKNLKDFFATVEPAAFEQVAGDYARAVKLGDGNGVVVDKMLPNFLLLGILRLAMPRAKFIYCTRAPLDNALSIWTLLFAGHMPWAYGQTDIARYYKSQKRLMSHWLSLFPDAIHEVNYEKTVASQEEETRKLLDFCGLPWDDRCLSFHQNEKMVKTASVLQVRKPIYGTSVGRGAKAAKYLPEFVEELEKEGQGSG